MHRRRYLFPVAPLPVALFALVATLVASCGRPPVIQARAALEPAASPTPIPTVEEIPLVELDSATALPNADPGVSADTIRLAMVSDGRSETGESDMFVSARRGIEAWARSVNSRGGLADRDVEVVIFESAVSNAADIIQEICDGDFFAMVGSLSYYDDAGVDLMNSADCGIPDFPAAAMTPIRKASAVTYLSDPYLNAQYDVAALRERILSDPAASQLSSNLQFEAKPFEAESIRMREAAESVGFGFGAFLVSIGPGSDMSVQADQLANSDAQSLVWTGAPSDLATLLRSLDEVEPEALEFVVCVFGCYDRSFTEQVGSVTTPVYTAIPHLPFDEQDLSSQIREYLVWISQSETVSAPAPTTDGSDATGDSEAADPGATDDTITDDTVTDDTAGPATDGTVTDDTVTATEGPSSEDQSTEDQSTGDPAPGATEGVEPSQTDTDEEASTDETGDAATPDPDATATDQDGDPQPPTSGIPEQASSEGFAAWVAGRLFEQAVVSAVRLGSDDYDPALLTRANLFDAVRQIESWDARGAYGEASPASRIPSSCMVTMVLIEGVWQRALPTERGAWDCSPENIAILRATADYGLSNTTQASSTNSQEVVPPPQNDSSPLEQLATPTPAISDPLESPEEPADG